MRSQQALTVFGLGTTILAAMAISSGCGGQASLGTIPADASNGTDASTSDTGQSVDSSTGTIPLFAGDCHKAPGVAKIYLQSQLPLGATSGNDYSDGVVSDSTGVYVAHRFSSPISTTTEIIEVTATPPFAVVHEGVLGVPRLLRASSFFAAPFGYVALTSNSVSANWSKLPSPHDSNPIAVWGDTLYHASAHTLEQIVPNAASPAWAQIASLGTLSPTAIVADQEYVYVVGTDSSLTAPRFLQINKITGAVAPLDQSALESATPILVGGLDQDSGSIYVSAARGDKKTEWGIAVIGKASPNSGKDQQTRFYPAAGGNVEGSLSVVHVDSSSIYYIEVSPPYPGATITNAIRRMCRDGSNDVEVASITSNHGTINNFAIDDTSVYFTAEGSLYQGSK